MATIAPRAENLPLSVVTDQNDTAGEQIISAAAPPERRVYTTFEHEPVPDFDAAAEEFRVAHREWLTLDEETRVGAQQRDEHLLRDVFRASRFLIFVREHRASFLAETKKRRIRGQFEQRVIRFLWHKDVPKRDKCKAWADGARWFADHCPHQEMDSAVKLACEHGKLTGISNIATGKTKTDKPEIDAEELDSKLETVIPAFTIENSPSTEEFGVYVWRKQGSTEFLFRATDAAIVRRAANLLEQGNDETIVLRAHPE